MDIVIRDCSCKDAACADSNLFLADRGSRSFCTATIEK